MSKRVFTVIRSVVAWERCYVTAETEDEAKEKAAAQDAWKMFDFDPGECVVTKSAHK